MGPFVPDIISDELNLIVALLLGIAFGFVLEQAGFSSSRRLAGVFYGYDFTVLRVFFTAGITAMLGVIFLDALGYLDADIIYVNPTFLGPALLGGAIMGVGFILGGYCPGTSICAAATGKKDALMFLAGGVIGAFLFGELFPLYDGFYASGAFGPLKASDAFGISQGLFAFLLILVAVGAFIITTRIEKKVNPQSAAKAWSLPAHILAGSALIALGAVVIFVPGRKTALLHDADSQEFQAEHPVAFMSADEIAFRILDHDPRLVIVDVRPAGDFNAMALPGSINMPMEGLFGKEFSQMMGERHKTRVFIDSNGTHACRAAFLAERLGYTNVRVLEGGLDRLRASILSFKQPAEPRTDEEADTYRFRAKASVALARMMQEARTETRKPATAVKKIVGGC